MTAKTQRREGGKMTKTTECQEELLKQFIDAAIEVHRELGPGYDEAVYENALVVEMDLRGIPYERQKTVDVVYKGVPVGEGRIDLFLGGEVVVELKAVEQLNKKHMAQVISYFKATKKPLGLLVNFHEYLLKNGLKRILYS
jgi:GxxExxY protein